MSFPNSPACIDEKTKEFRWYNKGDGTKGHMVFKFCPCCGYEIPKVESGYVDNGLTKKECLRLVNLLKSDDDPQKIERRLGKPQKKERFIDYFEKSELLNMIDIIFETNCDNNITNTSFDCIPYREHYPEHNVEYRHCSCPKLRECRNKPTTDIKYHHQDKFYILSCEGHLGKHMFKLLFCPFCSQSLVSIDLAEPTALNEKERSYFNTLKKTIMSVEDAYEILGQPTNESKKLHYEDVSDEANIVQHICGDVQNTIRNFEIISKKHKKNARPQNTIINPPASSKSRG